jgi:hypothetical protein
MTFSKGQIVKVHYKKYIDGVHREYTGNYEVIRTGRKYYLFCNENGQDWYPSKKELESAMVP